MSYSVTATQKTYVSHAQKLSVATLREMRGKKMNPTGNTKHGHPLYECQECKNEFKVTYTLLGSELCWDCYGDFKA